MFIRLLLIILTVICVIMGVHYFKHQFNIGPGLPDLSSSWQWLRPTPIPSDETAAAPLATRSADAPIESITQQLGTLMAVPLLLDDTGIVSGSVSLDYILEAQPTMVVLFGSDVPASVSAAVTASLHQLPNPPLIAVDHEGGSVQRLSGAGFTRLPSWQQLCSLTVQKRMELVASSAAQLRSAGVDIILGPVVDLTASGSALRSRTCAADPDKVAAISQEVMTTYQRAGIVSMIKHYPGIGSARADLHTQSAKVTLTPEDTRPFETLLTTNPTLPVMISHLRIDPADPNTPCSLSPLCVGELHRVFPEALLVSDALEMKSAGYVASSSAVVRPLPERASAALRAGVELLLFGPTVTETDLHEVMQQLITDYSTANQLYEKTLSRIGRIKQWRETLTPVYNGE